MWLGGRDSCYSRRVGKLLQQEGGTAVIAGGRDSCYSRREEQLL
jgi:hypothetical protein